MTPLNNLLTDIRACTVCEAHLDAGVNPIVAASAEARVVIIGQAPGRRVHESGIPWNDPSGDRLRDWLGVDRELFYDTQLFAQMPSGFCYPGTGKSGDLPPRPECAPLWHDKLLALLPNVKLKLLIGQYAQKRYLAGRRGKNLTETVRAWRSYTPDYLPLPHPSPRNIRWFKRNPWFESEVLPRLRTRILQLREAAV